MSTGKGLQCKGVQTCQFAKRLAQLSADLLSALYSLGGL